MEKTRDKIIQAAISEIEQSGLGATTKQIAKRATVNELTLFRHFGTKQQLIEAAIDQNLSLFLNGDDSKISGNLVKDLQALATQYVAFIDAHPGFIVAIFSPVDTSISETIIIPIRRRIAGRLLDIIRHYKQTNNFQPTDEADLIREFMGPLMVRAFLQPVLVAGSFNAEQYVHRFLSGHVK